MTTFFTIRQPVFSELKLARGLKPFDDKGLVTHVTTYKGRYDLFLSLIPYIIESDDLSIFFTRTSLERDHTIENLLRWFMVGDSKITGIYSCRPLGLSNQILPVRTYNKDLKPFIDKAITNKVIHAPHLMRKTGV